MAISSSTRKAGPFLGNDATTVFPFAFKVFTAADLLVVNTSALGVESDLELDVDYTVTLNADQDNDPGGSITRAAALPTGERLTITSDVAALQPLVLTNNGGFYPRVINDAFDKITIIAQQLLEQVGRSLKLPISSTASATLPDPVANSILAWNSDASGFVNIDPTDLVNVAAYSEAFVKLFAGDGVETDFELDYNPGVLANLDVSISGVTQVGGEDFTWIGTTIMFDVPPPDGTRIQVRYTRVLPPVDLDAATTAAEASATAAAADAVATAADRVQTGLDRVATAADRVQTGLDRAATGTARDEAVAATAGKADRDGGNLTGGDAAAFRAALLVGDPSLDLKARYVLSGSNAAGDQAKIEAALAAVSPYAGLYLRYGAGSYPFSGGPMVVTRAVDLKSEMGASIRADYAGVVSSPVAQINIREVKDQIDVVDASVRNMLWEGGNFFAYNTTTPGTATGSYAVAVNDAAAGPLTSTNPTGTYYTQINFRLIGALLGAKLGGLYFGGKTGEDSIFFSGPEFCTIENGWKMEHVSDGMRGLHNLHFGTLVAHDLSAREGAYNHTFEGGTASNRDGVLRVRNGARGLLRNMQVEYGTANGTTPNANVDGAYVALEGVDYPCIGWSIERNNFGSTLYVNRILSLDNAVETNFDGNYVGLTVVDDLFFASANAKGFRWGPANVFRGTRSRVNPATAYVMTDATRLLRVGFEIGVGTYNLKGIRNLWINAADVLAARNGSGVSGLSFLVTDTGQMFFQGSLVAGATTASQAILNFPDWLRPDTTQTLVVLIGTALVPLLLGTDGDLYAPATLPGTTIGMASAHCSIVLNVPYDGGP